MKKYYILVFILNTKRYYTLWYTDNKDGFVLDNNKKVKSFRNKIQTEKFVEENGYDLNSDEVTECLCDEIELSDIHNINCSLVLNFWNIVSDIAYSIKADFKGDRRNKETDNIYNKLFAGCNLSSIKPEREEDYIPKWNENEFSLMKEIIADGLKIIKQNFE